MEKVTPKRFRVASLFSGCGGTGLRLLWWFFFLYYDFFRLPTEIVFANDFDKDAASCYNSNPLLTTDGVEALLADIRSVDADSIPDFDILLA